MKLNVFLGRAGEKECMTDVNHYPFPGTREIGDLRGPTVLVLWKDCESRVCISELGDTTDNQSDEKKTAKRFQFKMFVGKNGRSFFNHANHKFMPWKKLQFLRLSFYALIWG